jgi:hypothetical protein
MARAVRMQEKVIEPPHVFLRGSEALEFTLRQLRSSGAGDRIEIRQFYVRPGPTLDQIRAEIAAAVHRGARVHLSVDYLFALRTLKSFSSLTKARAGPPLQDRDGEFQLDIINPPSDSMIEFLRRRYDVPDVSRVIDHVIGGEGQALVDSLRGSKIELELSKDELLTPEALLGALLHRVMAVSTLGDLLDLQAHLETFSNRYHE